MADILSGKLNGQVALITGASSGIGAAIAQAFLREGADLVAVARRGERLRALQEAAHALNRRCLAVEGDVREDETARRAVRAAIDDLGRLDLLVNNAGMAYYKSLAETSPEEYDTMMDTNMRGTFLFTRHVVPVFLAQRSGSIINIASMAGVMGFAGEAVYCATKFAQVGFTQALDRELRPHNIKVGAICPGGVKTEFALGTGRTEAGVAASGMLDPEDVAGAALLMATQSAGSRIMEIRLRPMVEPLAGRDPE
ncbi:MAG TPA: SDR family oxidoreductase [Ktedonobacterales bacterium]|nr:SDR family oxidoreductase [Ktedonobacterales bacterium]